MQSKRKVLVIYGKSTVERTGLVIQLLEASGARVSAGVLALNCIFRQVVYLRITEGMAFQEAITELSEGLELDLNPRLYPEQAVDRVIAALQQARCLIVLDNLENVLTVGQSVVPEWSLFLWALVDKDHDSQILITSREIPKDLSDPNRPKSAPNPRLVRSFPLQPAHSISLKQGLIAASVIVGLGLTTVVVGQFNQSHSQINSANRPSESDYSSSGSSEVPELPSSQTSPQVSTSNSAQPTTPNSTTNQPQGISAKSGDKGEKSATVSPPNPSRGQPRSQSRNQPRSPSNAPPVQTQTPLIDVTPKQSGFCSVCRWEKGSSQNTAPSINSNGTIEMTAAPRTDAVANTETRLIQTVENDFESTVRLKFSSTINYQRAVLGVRSSAVGGFGTLRLSMIENQRIESFIYEGEAHLANGLKSSPSDSVDLKIVKRKGQLSAYFRSQGTNDWVTVINPYSLMLPGKMDVFISVLSTDGSNSATATFSDWKITP